MWTLILVLLILALIGAIPAWPYSANWGHAPWGVILIILIVIVVARGGAL